MVKAVVSHVVFDWGFSRLKAWTLVGQRIIQSDFCYTNTLASSPAFYSDRDICKVLEWISKYLQKANLGYPVSIHQSSQMHCLSGTLTTGHKFISTWSDPPRHKPNEDDVRDLNGIPLLHSMPINKISFSSQQSACYLESNSSTIDRRVCRIRSLTSPLSLIFTELFNTSIPCSTSWWDSTCIPLSSKQLPSQIAAPRNNTPQQIYVSSNIGLSLPQSITIFPEVGDLQASTYKAVCDSDIVLNLGTGSQLLFNSSELLTQIPYYRTWNESRTPTVCISHLPCGRLLEAITGLADVTFSQLMHIFSHLDLNYWYTKIMSAPLPILFYPGYCYVDRKYKNNPSTSLAELSRHAPEEILVSWVYQYALLAQSLCQDIPTRNISLSIIGNLGGFTPRLVEALSHILPPNYQVSQRDITLPDSLVSMNTQEHTSIYT